MALDVAKEDSVGSGLDAASVQNSKILDSPRSREACRRLGLVLEDLHYRPKEAFAVPGVEKHQQVMRYDHFERNRKKDLALVLAERAKVIAQNARKGEVPGVQSAQFLNMLENLFDKEAKRLETDLKTQLRSHSSSVKENETQLRREEDVMKKDQLRELRSAEAEKMKKEVGEQAKERIASRVDANTTALKKLDEEFQYTQDNFARAQLAEEERLQKFKESKSSWGAEKSAHWRARVESMKLKKEEMTIMRRQDCEQRLGVIDAKVSAVTLRREEENMKRQLKSEEHHLQLMDVRQRKDRIERVDSYRRNELKEQVDGDAERIETLLALKDQLLEQRKARSSKAAATRSSRGLSLRRDCLPGPGQYEAGPSCMIGNPTIKMAKANTPDFIDQTIKATKQNPAPGAYDAKILPSGDLISESCPSVLNFGSKKRSSFLDEATKAKESIPAPGRYEFKSLADTRAIKMRPESISSHGRDKYSTKSYPVWARPGTETPGPSGYCVDEFMRKDTFRKARRSLPNLAKDMLRPGKVC